MSTHVQCLHVWARARRQLRHLSNMVNTRLRYESLVLLRNRLLTRGLCQILVDLSPIVGVSWEFYFVCSFLPWNLGCAHFVDFTYGLYEITAVRPAPPPGA